MATLETGIFNALLNTSGVTNVVGNKIRPLALSKTDDRPCVTYEITERRTEGTLDGQVADYKHAEFELGIFGNQFDDVVNVSEAARDALDNNGQTISGVEFAPCLFDSETDIQEVIPQGEEMPVYLRVQTYKVLYKIVD